ncbi:hypothetical protein GCM10011579_033640 [Streptomyces albiflavescens]|uniref:Resolvase/invertase-type recombinase catalytic domain-containing protein n=1 Tax=Streptomyces albiflavescens TaxID=1623582 RepID=A0A918D4Q9_9ACTN|nr:hypothetical protein GCM10011579_033640 [Streptomyces albiflavescens]
MLLQILGPVVEFEQVLNLERTVDGLAASRARTGGRSGDPAARGTTTPHTWRSPEITAPATLLQVRQPTPHK